MENRLNVKDIVLIALLLILIIAVVLSSIGYNRQWDTIKAIEKQMGEQTTALSDLARTMRQGGFASAGQTERPAESQPGFERELAVHAMPGYAEGDWLVDVFPVTAVDKLTPLVSTDIYQSRVEQYVLDSLIAYDPETLQWRSRLATSWEVSPDGLTYSYKMRPDAVFSDGSPVTSEDVVFSYNLIMNPDINCPRLRPYYEKVESVTADGPHQVVFRLKEPYFQGYSITGGIGVMSKKYYSQFTAEEFNVKPGLLFGSGPYKLQSDPKDWEPGSGTITLVRNEDYWGPRPAFDQLRWRMVADPVARETSFRNAEVDSFAIPADRYHELKQDENLQSRGSLHVYESLRGGYLYIGWNQERDGKPTLFTDKRVRQALSMLINREQICQSILSGLGRPSSGPFHPLGWQADPSIEPWPYDPGRAKALLAEAGFKDRNSEGVLVGPDGQPFRFKLTYPAGAPWYDQMVLYLRDTFAEAGIVIEPDNVDFTIVKQRLDDRQYDAISLGWGGSVETDPKQMFHSETIADGGDNFLSYRNPVLDKLIDDARVTLDDEQRLAKWRQVHRVLHEEQPYAFLFSRKSAVYLNSRIQNAKPTPIGMNLATEMFVPQDLQRWGN